MTFADWKRLSPEEAARRVHTQAALLSEAQRRAVFAMLACEAEISGRLAHVKSDEGLAGIPFVVKDVFDVASWPTRAGSTFLNQVRPTPKDDGALVARLRETGAILAGKTHLHEFAYGITGENPHHGDVEHPRFPGRTSGGSSSGSAAAVAAGVVPLAFGTDTAGSIRVPAAFCGLFGFRMTPHHPWIADAFPLAPSFDTAGWFTANAGDMATTLATLLGSKPTGRKPRGAWLPFADVDPALDAAQTQAALTMAEPMESTLAVRLREVFAEAPAIFNALRAPEAWAVHAAWADKWKSSYDPVVWARVDAGHHVTAEAMSAARVALERLQSTLDEVWQTYDFLVLPATPCVAPTKAECTQATRDRIFRLTTPVSVAGLPALTVPVMLPDGFSTGLQIVAPAADSPVFADVLAQCL
ncbi:MAG: amidase [Verrucomicrobiota bacterium]